MQLNRRQVIAAAAATGAHLGLGVGARAALGNDTIYKAIPSSGERLPVIGIGTNRWILSDSAKEMAELRETLAAFHAHGGRVIDTAPAYRSSESAVGTLARQVGIKDPFFLATKVDRASPAEGIERMRASLDKLGRAQIDLMQVHNLRGAEAQMDTLIEWREEGTLRYIGLTTSRNSQHAEMRALMEDMPLDFVQLNYSLADRTAEDYLLPLARDKNIAVLVNLPFARGRVFRAFGDRPLPDWAADFDCTSWAQFALKYVVSHPAVTCAIPGTTSPRHARDNMGANRGRLPDAELRRRQEALFASL